VSAPKDVIAAVRHADPYPFYRQLRETRPIYFDETLGFWVLSSAEMVTAVFGESGFQVRPVGQLVPPSLQATEIGAIYGSLVRMSDGEYQRLMKHAVVTALSQLDRLRLQSLTEAGIIDYRLRENEQFSQSLHNAMYRLPAYVVAALLGVEAAALRQVAELTGYFVGALSPTAVTTQIERGSAATRSLLDMFEAQAERPLSRQSTVFRQLLAQAAADGLGPAQVTANAIGFLMQTFDATAGLIGNAFLVLQRAGAPATLRDWPSFLAEVLRYDPPVQNTRRYATHYFELGGQTILAEDTVLLVMAAANRDPALNPAPDLFQPRRVQRNSLALGHGAHLCPGNLLAITIAASTLAVLWPRWRDTEAARQFAEAPSYRVLPNARIPEIAQ
jgi:cytochrome P450